MQILSRSAMTQRVVPLPVPEGGADSSERIAALQINMMGRSVRCKRLLPYVMRVPFASRNGDVKLPRVGGVRRTHEQDSSIKPGKACAQRAART